LLINLLLTALLSLLLGWHFKRFGASFSNRTKLAWVLPAVALPTVLVIAVVKSSLALSLGLVGALSIVRFRTPVKEPEELAYLFLAIAVGLGMGADQRWITVTAILFILVILTVRAFFVRDAKYPNLYMDIAIDSPQRKDTLLKDVLAALQPHVGSIELRRFDVDRGTVHGTFYLNCKNVEALMAVQAELSKSFPEASVTFVEQSNMPGV